jgi:hypothetical protein
MELNSSVGFFVYLSYMDVALNLGRDINGKKPI